MSRRLNAFAHRLIRELLGREHEIDGYWAIGKLCAEAKDAGRVEVDIDLDAGVPPSPIAAAIHRFARTRLDALSNGFGGRIRDPRIHVHFGSFKGYPVSLRLGRGAPFVCTVSLTAAGGRVHRVFSTGYCAPHDPALEQRSCRS